MRTRVKICGITRAADARLAVDAGADAVGLVFYEKSPRYVNSTQAAEICRALPAFVSTVALFKDADAAFIGSILGQVDIDLIQFHGSESVDFCEQFGRPYIKALGMRTVDSARDYLDEKCAEYASARAVLLDGHAPGEAGGKGESFDWSEIGAPSKPVVLAGGLNAENVQQAIESVHPYAVDVSSGVEREPGIKDGDRLAAFFSRVVQTDAKAR